MGSLFLACLPTPRSICKCFGYNLLKGRAPWGSWKQLGVSSGAENCLHQHLHLPSVVPSFFWKVHVGFTAIFLGYLCICGHVTGSNQWNVKGALHVRSRLTLFIMDMLSLCSLLSPAHQLEVNISGDLESIVSILLLLSATILSAWVPAWPYGADNPCPSSCWFKNKLVFWVTTWYFLVYYFYQLVLLQPIQQEWKYIIYF